MSFAQITIVGNVGQLPEFKDVKGKTVCNFSIAVNRKVKDEKVTTWYSVVCWDDRKNEIIKNYVRKGNQVMVVGQLQTRAFKDKNGDTRTALEVEISFGGHIVLLSNSEQRDDAPAQTRNRPAAAELPPDEDIPF